MFVSKETQDKLKALDFIDSQIGDITINELGLLDNVLDDIGGIVSASGVSVTLGIDGTPHGIFRGGPVETLREMLERHKILPPSISPSMYKAMVHSIVCNMTLRKSLEVLSTGGRPWMQDELDKYPKEFPEHIVNKLNQLAEVIEL